MAGKNRASLLEDGDGRDLATCDVCMLMMEIPTSGCPEGHAFCKKCIIAWLQKNSGCPNCRHDMDASRLQRNRPLEKAFLQLRTRCEHGPGEGAVASQGCGWIGRLCELEGHLATTCGYTPVACPNAAAGCTESVLRKDAARHASETCAKRTACTHCGQPFAALALPAHEGSCPEAQVQCPNAAAGCTAAVLRKDAARHAAEACVCRQAPCKYCSALFAARDLTTHERSCPEVMIDCPNEGCDELVTRGSMAEHRGACEWEEVECVSPGCDVRMPREEMAAHVAAAEASGAHVQRAGVGARLLAAFGGFVGSAGVAATP